MPHSSEIPRKEKWLLATHALGSSAHFPTKLSLGYRKYPGGNKTSSNFKGMSSSESKINKSFPSTKWEV